MDTVNLWLSQILITQAIRIINVRCQVVSSHQFGNPLAVAHLPSLLQLPRPQHLRQSTVRTIRIGVSIFTSQRGFSAVLD